MSILNTPPVSSIGKIKNISYHVDIREHLQILLEERGSISLGDNVNTAKKMVETFQEGCSLVFYRLNRKNNKRSLYCCNYSRKECRFIITIVQCCDQNWYISKISEVGHTCGMDTDRRSLPHYERVANAVNGTIPNLNRHPEMQNALANRLATTGSTYLSYFPTYKGGKFAVEELTTMLGRPLIAQNGRRMEEGTGYLVCLHKKKGCKYSLKIVANETGWLVSALTCHRHSRPECVYFTPNYDRITFSQLSGGSEEFDWFLKSFVDSFLENYLTYDIFATENSNDGPFRSLSNEEKREMLENNCKCQFADYIGKGNPAKGGFILQIEGTKVGAFLYDLMYDGTLYIAEMFVVSKCKRRGIARAFLSSQKEGLPFAESFGNLEILCRKKNTAALQLYKTVQEGILKENQEIVKPYGYDDRLYAGFSTRNRDHSIASPAIPLTSWDDSEGRETLQLLNDDLSLESDVDL